MNLQIIRPDVELYKDEIKLVQLPGINGSFEIMNNHAPLISYLKKGIIKVIDKNNEIHKFNIKGGVIEVLDNNVIVLVD